MSENKIFIGKGKAVEKFDGNLIECSICLTDISSEAGEHIYEYNGKKYINIKVQKRKDGADQYGKTHFIEVNTWKPEKQNEATSKTTVTEQVDDLPF